HLHPLSSSPLAPTPPQPTSTSGSHAFPTPARSSPTHPRTQSHPPHQTSPMSLSLTSPGAPRIRASVPNHGPGTAHTFPSCTPRETSRSVPHTSKNEMYIHESTGLSVPPQFPCAPA